MHFKTVRYFSRPIFSLFSYLKNALQNLVIELCSELIKKNLRLFSKVTRSFVAIESLTFSKIQNSIFIAQESPHYFGLINHIP